ncbi:hypothetical protein [Phenylobacterium deserti]|uniref:Uncharacterized protein n=1 Tax=Phenylobacterium deserti TaxID=1914756 RepID=A0A328AF96_9CAUL|nr:hypothetical protein [Phenylobacterium deserti]RAK51468.1 hypothetical protein DJ018_16160 [Phenylobacterium deserti]
MKGEAKAKHSAAERTRIAGAISLGVLAVAGLINVLARAHPQGAEGLVKGLGLMSVGVAIACLGAWAAAKRAKR